MTKERHEKSPREISLDILMDIIEKKAHSHITINKSLNKYQTLEKQDRAFISIICEGTLERLITIDYIINQYSKIKVRKMKPLIRTLLRLSVYQIKYMDQTPDFAICNEGVKIAKKRGFHNLSGFINGVLRNIIRNLDKIIYPDKKKEPIKYLSIRYSAPEWLVLQFIKEFDFSTTEKILASFLNKKETSIRCNLNRIKVEDLRKELIDSAIVVKSGKYLPYALKISQYDRLEQLKEFQEGFFQVQDESSMLVGEIGGTIASRITDALAIDVCAAPGGKTLHIAEKLENKGFVISRDVSEQKVNLILENINRLGYPNIKAEVHDALKLDKKLIGKADLLIADLPCSGLGVIGKKPDIKYNMTAEKQKELVALQREILNVIHQYVKPGGLLLYSTCTINKDENIENIKWFLEHYPFYLEDLDGCLPEILTSDTSKEGYIQLIPGIHDTDGFFIAKLVRKI